MRPIIFALILTLALAVPATASYVEVHMYVDGQLGGQIVVDGAAEPPVGTCGAHFVNPETWYWADGYYSETGPLEGLLNNGANTNSLTLTGTFTGCPQANYLAVTPATPNGGVPAGSISLVVQVDTDDIEWLDFNGNPVPEAPPWPEEHVFDPCEIPDFCETLTIGSVCFLYPDLCESDGILVRIADLTASIPAQTANARKQLAAGRRQDAGRSLALARSRAGLVIGQLGALRARQVRIDREVANSYPSTGAAISLGNHSAGYEFGVRHTASCDKSLILAQKALTAGRTPDWASLDAACLQATEPLSRSRTWLGRLQAWSLRAR